MLGRFLSLFLITLLCQGSLLSQKLKDTAPFSIGERLTIQSEILDQDRVLNIYLPNSYYEDSTRNYPVIYLLDGSKDEDFIHIAGLVQFNSFSWIGVLPETIVVGIENIDRKHDFTYPSRDTAYTKEYPTTGGSANFIRFIEEELQPFIENRYSIGKSMIIGQSLGGLLATEILFKKPNLFDNYIIVSPSLWYDYQSLLEAEVPDLKDHRVFVAYGKEGEIMERVTNDLYVKLDKEGELNDLRLGYAFLPHRDHGDALHEAAYKAFEFFYSSADWANFEFDEVRAYRYDNSVTDTVPYYAGVIHYDLLNPTIITPEGALLNDSQTELLLKIMNGEMEPNEFIGADCYNPRHGFIFYRDNKAVGHISICLECNGISAVPRSRISDVNAFRPLLKELGLIQQ